MRLQGVTTTGIYCRATCSASPRPDHVRPVKNAIDALAKGYRPCLRCRPDQLPDLGLDEPAVEVAHAVRLVAEGYLDSHTTDQLARRIGYSTRHLVRLFEEHIGASPDFVARACRAHLARRLLDDTDRSVTDIAFAAGFASIRQMNRVMRELFGFSPSELRKKRRRRPLDPLDGGLRLRLAARGPLAAAATIDYLEARTIPGVEAVEQTVYRRTMNACGHPGMIEVRAGEDRESVDVTLHLPTFGSVLEQVERLRGLFALGRDSTAAERHLRRDPLLGRRVRRAPGLRLPGAFDRFETAVRVVVGQQVSVSAASTVCGRLVQRFGDRIDLPLASGPQFLFPGAEALMRARPRDLSMPEARARTVARLARAVAGGDLDLTAPRSLDDTLAALQEVPGIGPWTANLIAARAMGEPDAFAASDLGLRRNAARLLGREKPLSAAELLAVAERWRPYRTTAMAYLWMIADVEGRVGAAGG